jgi:N-acetylglucosaminyldiphosphoundecaprenol N-acetyl-beta-D-mannosaminyltransferase
LPDGIALRLYLKKKFWKKVSNLNGTDFVPYFLWWYQKVNSEDDQKMSFNNFSVFLYWAKKEVIEKVYKKFKDKRNIVYWQDWYSELDWDKVSNSLQTSSEFSSDFYNIKILLVWLWTPKQEIWIQNNLDKIKKYWFVVFGVGWLFDFLAWEEKRAPSIFRKLNLERLWRMFSNPRKNFKKGVWSFKLFKYLVK